MAVKKEPEENQERASVSSEYDEFVKLIMEDMRRAYSEITQEHALHPRNVGAMEDADGYGAVTGPHGDTLQIWLKVKDGIISDASFMTNGCWTITAVGSMVTEMARGKSIAEAEKISEQDILTALNGLPEPSVHCALMAARALRAAIDTYQYMKTAPWRKAHYRHYRVEL